ncbi:AraC family transcriptional regulator [Bordetella genomosp. 4]|uniref:AraC family transcriptional regulator n=1 Tax=Bordetella genomosp. 4 TaxID=463044 RepID=UPI000B9EBD5D|nr:AraC family transcriptional regulator [Bordetella genomosp. 4]OZI51305.1 AraC family transcriptional regulator [Bordetella genomosp. 4]
MFDESYPLQHYCLLQSANAAEVKDQVSHHLWSHRMRVGPGEDLSSRLYGVQFGNAALYDLHYGAAVEIDAGDIASCYLVRATLRGCGEVRLGGQRAGLKAGSLTVSSPSERSTISIDKDCRSLILRVDRLAMERHLQSLLQRPLRQPLVFEVDVPSQHPGVAAVRATFEYLCQLYAHPALHGVSQTLSGSFTDYLAALLLMQLPHNYSEALTQDRRQPLPAHVRKARDYIEQRADEVIPLSALASHCGVSVRTLQNGFMRFLGQNPSDYMRNQRLVRVHAALQAAGPGTSVTDILVSHGVMSFGHFANHYRKRYGCLPSETLRTANN